jgi:DNA-binding winged helix-turn-helix (wHTH) protein/tetratricopeptide (TPR) repeat protein
MKLSSEARSDAKETEFSFGNFRLDHDGTFFRGDAQIHLPPKELAALRLLLTHAGQIVSSAQLKHGLWGDVHVTSDSVPRCMSSLRALLEPDQCIQTIYKRGYRLAGPVQHSGAQAHRLFRLAVMPFASGRDVPDHLGPAIAEEVTSRLTALAPSWVSVLARDSVFTLAGRGQTAVQVGPTLKADLVLSGVLFAMPTHYRLRTEMIRIEDGTQIWVEEILVARRHLLGLESELVQRLVFRLGGELTIALNGSNGTERRDAYDIFLRGHYEWQTHERHRMQDGMQYLARATELDPSLIAAKVDLTHACISQEFYGFMSPDAAAHEIRRIADSISDITGKAPALLPALGWISFHADRDLHRALEMFSASAHLPHDPWTTRLRVMLALSRHRFDEALEWIQSALVVDPYAPSLHASLAWALHLAGQSMQSITQIEKCLSLFPDDESSHMYAAIILAFNGQAERAAQHAEEIVRRTPYFDMALAVQAYVLACSGQRDEAFGLLERLQWLTRERFVLRSFTPAAYVALGDLETAASELQAAADLRCPWFFQTLADPRLESLRGRPEFEQQLAVLQQMELSAREDLDG